jgi:hypothetical protein
LALVMVNFQVLGDEPYTEINLAQEASLPVLAEDPAQTGLKT